MMAIDMYEYIKCEMTKDRICDIHRYVLPALKSDTKNRYNHEEVNVDISIKATMDMMYVPMSRYDVTASVLESGKYYKRMAIDKFPDIVARTHCDPIYFPTQYLGEFHSLGYYKKGNEHGD